MRRLFFFLFFLSGFSALIYEVVWARQLGLVFGNTVYAVSTILTIFFAGLALGSFLFGRVADHANGKRIKILRMVANEQTTVLAIYGLLELGIGLYAAATPWIFRLIEQAQISLVQNFQPSYSGFSLLTFGLAFLGLILPTILMGGTLPVISRFLANIETKSGEVMGNLYGLNTLGGVLGVLLAGFFLIRYLGVRETIWLAVFINIVIGGVVIWYANRTRMKITRMDANPQRGKQSISMHSHYSNSQNISILIAFAITGFAALALEVLWTRVLILVFGSSTYAFTIILAVFLLGIALGSFLASRFLLERKNLVGWLVGLQLLLGIGVILVTTLLPQLPFFFLDFYKGNSDFSNNLWASFVISFLVILPLTTLMGLIFPLGIRLVTANFTTLAKDLGKLYSFNTVGGILGAFAAGFLLIPLVGLQKGILLAAFFYLLADVLMVFIFPLGPKIKIGSLTISFILVSTIFWLPAWDKQILSSGVFVYYSDYLQNIDPKTSMIAGNLLFYKEGLSATVAVKKSGKDLSLKIDGKTDASTGGDLPTEVLAGHLAPLFHREPRSALVIGLGSGITLGSLKQYPLEKIDVVEIEPAIIEASRYFDKFNNVALDDPRVKLEVGDGYYFLLSSKDKYDIIASEPSNPWAKGNANLFTREYFALAKEHLNEDGIFIHWVQYYRLDSENVKTVLATFHSVFPQMTVWAPMVTNDLLLIGTRKPQVIDYPLLLSKLKEEEIAKDLGRVGILTADQIISLYLFDGERVGELAKGVNIHTNNLPSLEYKAPFAMNSDTKGQNAKMLFDNLQNPYLFLVGLSSEEKKKFDRGLELRSNILLAKIAMSDGKLQEGLTHYQNALEIAPDWQHLKNQVAEIYLDNARISYLEKDLAKAKEALLKALSLNSKFFNAQLNLGVIYFQEGNFQAAMEHWAIAKELDPESPEVNQNLKLLERYVQ